MNNSLIPTPTVDRNGRSTTVYRRAARTASNAAIPAPTVPNRKKAPEKPSTPLPVPEPIGSATNEDLKRHAQRLRSMEALSLRKNPNADDTALIYSILDRGILEPEQVCVISDHMGLMSHGERFRDYDYNMFLLAERFVRNGGSKDVFNYTDMSSFSVAIGGIYKRRREADIKCERITTEEELESTAALLRMYMEVRQGNVEIFERSCTSKDYQTATGRRLNGGYFRNQGFAELVRERYEEYPLMERYVRERGVPKNKNELDALKAYLDNGDEHVASIAEGWL